MKSRKPLLAIFALSSLGALYFYFHSSPLESSLPTELLTRSADEKASEKTDPALILPFGYTLGVWPKTFRGEPIVTRLTYLKGPPAKFLDQMIQVWRPVEVELSLFGPKTLSSSLTLEDWRACFRKEFGCAREKQLFWAKVFPERKAHEKDLLQASWYESTEKNGPRGVHLLIKTKTYQIDRFAVITAKGTTQVFSMKSVLSPVGLEARELFLKTLGSLTVSDDLTEGRRSIEARLKSVNIEALKKIENPKERLQQLIQVQNWIYAYLSVDPTSIDSFYHLSGITHRLAMDLINAKERFFENQEAWILNFQPLLGTLIQYARDFPNSEKAVKSMEALLEDFLLKQSKIGRH
jgi:hypothetical protein